VALPRSGGGGRRAEEGLTFPECDEAVIVLHTANDVRAIDVLQKM